MTLATQPPKTTSQNCTLFVDHLTVIDFSYLCHERGIVGESWIVDLELTGGLDQQGMIFDFGHIKKLIKQVIDGLFDHKLLVPTGSPGFHRLESKENQEGQESKELHQLTFHFQPNRQSTLAIKHSAPHSAVCEMPIEAVSPSAVLPYLIQEIKAVVPKNVMDITLTLREEQIDGPFYQYSHGLQYHEGDCQRIAHGHRSRLEVYLDHQRSPEAEQAWCDGWKTIYIATRSHIKDRFVGSFDHLSGRLDKSSSPEKREYLTLAYQAQQGPFEITLPAELVHIMETETTVELIAAHMAEQIGRQYPNQAVRVKAFEGVLKGAIATA